MTSIRSRPTVDHAATAAEAVRALNHLTLGRRALGEPAELDRLVAELAIMAHLQCWAGPALLFAPVTGNCDSRWIQVHPRKYSSRARR